MNERKFERRKMLAMVKEWDDSGDGGVGKVCTERGTVLVMTLDALLTSVPEKEKDDEKKGDDIGVTARENERALG